MALDVSKVIDQYGHRMWNQDSGLRGAPITAIAQTGDHHLWLGTQHGLVRFDGVHFAFFDRATIPALRDNEITALVADKQGHLWIGTASGGLLAYDGRLFRSFTTRDGLTDDRVNALKLDPSGVLWIATGSGLARLTGGRIEADRRLTEAESITAIEIDREGGFWLALPGRLLHVSNKTREVFPLHSRHAAISVIRQDRAGTIWAGGDEGGFAVVNGKKFEFDFLNEGLSALCEDRDGNLWAGLRELGLRRLTGHWRNGVYRVGVERSTTVTGNISTCHEDAEGSLWAGSESGELHQLNDVAFTTFGKRHGLLDDYIYSVFGDSDGTLWIGSPKGLNRYRNGRFDSFSQRHGLPANHVNAIWAAPGGPLWIGTNGGICRFENGRCAGYTEKDGLTSDRVRALLEDRHGAVWVGTFSNGLDILTGDKQRHYGADTALTHDAVRALFEDRGGAVWVGTWHGVTRFYNGQYTKFVANETFPSIGVTTMCEDDNGTLWLGGSSGLVSYRSGKFTPYLDYPELRDGVDQLIADTIGNLWIGTSNGILCIRIADLKGRAEGRTAFIPSRRYGVPDGLATGISSVSTHPLAWRTRDGRLWFATQHGLSMVDPAHLRKNQVVPPVAIERIIVDQKDCSTSGPINIPPGEHRIEIHYTALSLVNPARLQFKYRMEAVDRGWIDAGQSRTAFYTSLPPGKHRFQLIASNDDGVWNETGVTVNFYLAPFFYQTTTFYGLAAACICLAALGGHRLRFRRLNRRRAELERLVDERTQELKAAEATAREATGAAEAAAQAKGQFLANMSHEIRTPMNGVLGMTDLAMQADCREEQMQYLKLVKDSGAALLTVINDILDYSKIEANKLILDPFPFSLRDTMAHPFHSLAIQAHEKGIELAYEIADDVPDLLVGDSGRLRQVILNLVSNAVKFTDRGEVVLRVAAEEQIGEGALLRFSVHDTGIGIAPEKRASVFEAFSQADGSTTRRYGGSGLGLTICKRLVAMMGGEIRLESKVGHGTTVHFTAAFDVQKAPAAPPRDFAKLSGLRVLIVDDNATIRRMLRTVFEKRHMNAIAVANGEAALTVLEQKSFDLLVIDLNMPGMDGFVLAEEIHNRWPDSGVKILALSTLGQSGDQQRCRALGISANIYKPISSSDLLETAHTLLTAPAGEGGRQVSLANPESNCEQIGTENRSKLNVLVAEDNRINQLLTRKILEKQGHRVTVVDNGRSAVEAFEADSFDVILMDIQMPKMDGLAATAAIREREARHRGERGRAPIIALTAHAMSDDRERCLKAGMDGYVAKPIRAHELFASIQAVCRAAEPDSGALVR
jgi:signal transduction histidine kinase/ligand-binding sensor domain-containing protein/DNA-binding response OmpR family regulator